MKKVISIVVSLISLLMICVPVFAVGSPTAPNQFVNTSGKTEISGSGNGFNSESSTGGITIMTVGKDYVAIDPDGSHSIHTDTNGSDFEKLVSKDLIENNRIDPAKEYALTAIVDIHLWGDESKAPNTFTINADVKEGDKVIVHHHIEQNGEYIAHLIPNDDVEVGNGTITVKNVESFSLWSFTKIVSKDTGNNGGNNGGVANPTDSYLPPRTDVE